MVLRRPRLTLVALAALVALATLPRTTMPARAAACGDDSSPPCPMAQTVVPDVINTPVRGATIELRGTGLGLVVAATLQPGGSALPILSRGDTGLTLRLPDRLAPGSYQVELAIPGQTQGFSTTPFFQVADGSAQRSLPQFTFAPAAPAAGHASATATDVPALFTPRPDASTSWASVLRLVLLVLAVGAVSGGLATVLYTVVRRWRTVKLRDLTYAAMDRRLAELWSMGEQHVEASPTPSAPGSAATARAGTGALSEG